MRKIVALLIVVAGFMFFLMKRGEQIALDSIPQNTLVVFTKTGCYHCHDAMAFIDGTVKKQYPTLPVLNWDVDHDNHLTQLLSVAKHYRIPNDRLGTPVLLYNGQILIGWSPSYEQKLLGMLKSGIPTRR
ncbi:MAG: hypothetical protein SPL08_04545 [Pseudomonadota bacterium]|nr:hypothetical protein [Pseudomonadota bacterium]